MSGQSLGLGFHDADRFWRTYGFRTPRAGLAADAPEAVRIARDLGSPVALKIESPDIVHKTDIGGVLLNLRSPGEVEEGAAAILSAAGRHAPHARVLGIRVEEMCTRGVEVIMGLVRDPQFGPCIMVGLGGVLTELLEDVSLRVLPITERDAREMIEEIKGRAILEGYRGQPPVSKDMLVDLLLRVNGMGMDLAGQLGSIDLNPIRVWESEHRLLDGKILLETEHAPSEREEPNTRSLETFFEPRSIALIGASAVRGKIGHAVLDSLLRAGFAGSIYPVNPSRSELSGQRVYPNLREIPGPVDLVVVALPLATVPDLVEDCAAKGVRSVVIISGGGKELGGDSKALETRIATTARAHGIRIVGPNCIGIYDAAHHVDTLFMVRERMLRPRAGRIAMITQSGTVGVAFLEAAARIGISKFVSYGNRSDVDEADLLSFLARDASTEVIACYVEGLADGRKFFEAARAVNAVKPVVIFKAGRTPQGARASVSHTGFFGGRYAVSRGAFRQAGLIDVDSIDQLYEAAEALALQPRGAGRRMAMLSNGAGTVVQAIDMLSEAGLEMPVLAGAIEERLRRSLPPHCVIQNPVDLTGSAGAEDYRLAIEALFEDSGIDVIMPWFVLQDTPLGEDIVDVLRDLAGMRKKPIVCGAMGGPYTDRMAAAIEDAGVPVARSVSSWVAAARALVIAGRSARRDGGS